MPRCIFLRHCLDADLPSRGINALRMSMVINAQNPLSLPVPLHTEVVVELTPLEASPSYLIDILVSFGTPSIPNAVFAFSLPPALFGSWRVKRSPRRTAQEFRSCFWNDTTCGNHLRTMYLTRSGLSRRRVFLLVTNP